MSLPKIYILSGLGADERVFQLLDLSGFEVVFIQWIRPNIGEHIKAYATRLLAQIKTENPILIGLSFGGMMSIELSKLIPTEKIIIISSIKTRQELPYYYRFIGKFGLHKMVPVSFIKKANLIANWAFGLITVFEKHLLKLILLDMDEVYVKWAIDQVFTWQNDSIPENLVHIHGTADRVFPIKFVQPNYIVENGGHFMVLNKHKNVSEILHQILDKPKM
jgi:pimeloyl-ACP methyl ester carboxylesterase